MTPGRLQVGHPLLGPLPQLVDVAELDRLGGAGLGAGRRLVVEQPVVAEGALLGDARVLDRRNVLVLALLPDPAVDDAEGAAGHAVAAPVADVVLHHHGAELGAEQRTGRADVQTPGVRAVLADVRRHQPAELAPLPGVRGGAGQVERRHPQVHGGRSLSLSKGPFDDLRTQDALRHPDGDPGVLGAERLALLDELDVAPGVRAQGAGVVVGAAEQLVDPVLRDPVPLLAGHLAGLAADADRGVGEEPLARRRLRPAGAGRRSGRAGRGEGLVRAPGARRRADPAPAWRRDS